MIIKDERHNAKIIAYHEAIRKGNTIESDNLREEIYNDIKGMIPEIHAEINNIADEKDTIINQEKYGKKTHREVYAQLIILYRKAFNLSKDISKIKKNMRKVKQ